MCGQGFANDGSYFRSQQFDGVHEFVVAKCGDAHLEADAGDAAERFVHLKKFSGYGFGITHHQCSGRATQRFKLRACDRRPATLFADLGEGFGITGEEVVGGLLVGVGDVAEGVDADF